MHPCQVREHIEKKNEKLASKKNKGSKKVTFEHGDWVWVHLMKEQFSNLQKGKNDSRGDGPFQVLKKINDNAYKIDPPNKYNISATFNAFGLSLFDVDTNSRANPFKREANNMT